MYEELKLTHLIKDLEAVFEQIPEHRTGKNGQYELADAGMGAFSVFFTQCPSFLARQQELKLLKGRSNAEKLFELREIPSDNQIRNLLDPVDPTHLGRFLSANISGPGTGRGIEKISFVFRSVIDCAGWDRILFVEEDPL